VRSAIADQSARDAAHHRFDFGAEAAERRQSSPMILMPTGSDPGGEHVDAGLDSAWVQALVNPGTGWPRSGPW